MAPKKRGRKKGLPRLVQDLPPELYDRVYKLTSAAAADQVINVDLTYKPPIGLQVNQASRELFMDSYHDNTIFYVTEDIWKKWSKSLHSFPSGGKDIRLIGPHIDAAGRTRCNLEQALKLRYRYCDYHDDESGTDDFTVSMKVTFGDPEKYMWLRCDEPLVITYDDYTKSAYSWYLEERAEVCLHGGPPLQPNETAVDTNGGET